MPLLAQAKPADIHYAAASGVFHLTWLLVALPVAGALVLLVGGRRLDARAPLIGCATVIGSFVWGLVLFITELGRAGDSRAVVNRMFTWMPVNGFHVDASLLLDSLSIVFVLLVTGVGSLIHIYSVGYMAHDPDRRRFFGYMNLFVAAMLLLVLGANFVLLYVGWEGVGLASYLLIGFWHARPSAAVAAKKAFIVNRVGDVGLSIAILVMFATVGSTAFDVVFGAAAGGTIPGDTVTAIGLLLLLGACAKSAQFPLQTWLLDAMEGPTPVSALIHAATMVTAGIYLVARANPIFDASPSALTVVAAVGAVTLVMGAVIGCAHDDIKKVLAASTMSQIGYMMLAVGLGSGAYWIGIYHLLNHGFFKANMFLGAGSVMHGMNDEVNMRKYGGLRKVMPVTFVTFGLGYLAIIGFPGLSGYWSKDKIIEAAFDKGGIDGWAFGIVALVGAGITAFYMTRLMLMTFFGERRWVQDAHPHESPSVMTVPMALLAFGSVMSGALFAIGGGLSHWLEPSLSGGVEASVHTMDPWVLTALAVAVMAIGMVIAWLVFGRRPVPAVAPPKVSLVTVAARRSLYGDALNEAVFMRPGQWLTRTLVFFDRRGVDGIVNGVAAFLGGSSGRVRRLQTGFVRSYALSIVGGAAVLVAALLLVRVG